MADPKPSLKACTARGSVLDHLSTDRAHFCAIAITAQDL
jgi:hypothetical protein